MIAYHQKISVRRKVVSGLATNTSTVQVAKDELEKQQRELHEMMQRLEESKNLEAEERHRLEEEILAKKNEVTENV